ncbi:MAG TPA: hypothetical protein VJH55_04115 [Candidatus Paceibacterota bacterium]
MKKERLTLKTLELAVKLPPYVDMVLLTTSSPGTNGSLRNGDHHSVMMSLSGRNPAQWRGRSVTIGEQTLKRFTREAPVHIEIDGHIVHEKHERWLGIDGKNISFIGKRKHRQSVIVVWKNGSVHPLSERTARQIRRVLSGLQWAFN